MMQIGFGEEGYLNTCKMILEQGQKVDTRSGPTRSMFGHQIKFSLEDNAFPLITTKKVFLKGIIHELLWFLKGSTNNNDLTAEGVHIWDEWAKKNGDLGPIYGKQWRRWTKGTCKTCKGYGYFLGGPCICSNGQETIDQIADLIKGLREDPFSRRHIVSAWNPSDIPDMALAPCHCLFQFYVRKVWSSDGLEPIHYLDCQLYQRSADMFLGVPFNIASYALLTKMIAQVVGLEPGMLIHTFGDMHIYENHLPQMDIQLGREAMDPTKLLLNPNVKDIDSFTYDDFSLIDYYPWPAIKGEVSV